MNWSMDIIEASQLDLLTASQQVEALQQLPQQQVADVGNSCYLDISEGVKMLAIERKQRGEKRRVRKTVRGTDGGTDGGS